MKKRNAGIIAYGTEEDREKLAVLADTFRMSGSELVIKMIREKFAELYGEVP
ncbi:hypothetical protein IB276_32870 [Ensifer sp. ENS04]|uniref:hypothetical protein n=1 Tax=Ensifer sp. ENS04 TaxID=2769281 RepID=UPI001782109D|nr:hypothetical protein [Ensifer sp. ENS04]MBD9544239.1 hypothetical protein [Ensifer sp. ENS04]